MSFCRKRDLDNKPFARLVQSLPKTFIFQHIFPFFFSFREEESLPIALIFLIFSGMNERKKNGLDEKYPCQKWHHPR